ncbi:MAG: efflux RND transporter permease subunit, partial [Deltaproteobacteria bacterium]|nr:efflux RND transporter permease subunit [Deltaproteobacteria bacterium]
AEGRAGGFLAALLRRPVGVGVSLVAVALLGVIAALRLPQQLIPSGFDPLFLWVHVPTLAANSGENERLVAEPVEDALATLPSVSKLSTFVRSDSVGFALELHPSADPQLSYQRVRERLKVVTPRLPEGSRFAFIWRHDPSDEPVLVVGVELPSGAEDPARVLSDRLMSALERVDGVSKGSLSGVSPKAVRVELRPRDLTRLGVRAAAVAEALRRDNFTLSAGALEAEGQRAWVRVSSRFESLEALRARPVAPHARLSDVATVRVGADPREAIYRINGRPAAAAVLYKASDANTVEVCEALNAALARALRDDPALAGYSARVLFDQGAFIRTSLEQIVSSALYGGLIAVACLMWFLRSLALTLLISSAIPLSLLATLGVIFLRGGTLNVLSMMGIILSVGMVIDNAIVVMDQVWRARRRGLSRAAAAAEGARGVWLAITLATLTTLVVFVPLMMSRGQPMLTFFISEVGAPVCYALLASLVIALVHLPVASVALRGGEAREGEEGWLSARYAAALGWVLRHRLASSALALLYLASVAVPLKGVARADQGGGGFGGATVHIVGPLNGPQRRLLEVTEEVERLLLARADELDIEALISEPGWSSEHMRVQLSPKPPGARRLSRDELNARLKALLPERPGFKLRLFRGQGSGDEGGVPVTLFGPDLEGTTAHAERLAERLRALPGAASVELELPEGSPELSVSLHPTWARALGLSPGWVAASVAAELQEREVGRFYGEERWLSVLVTSSQEGLTPETVARAVPSPTPGASPYAVTPLDGVSERALRPGLGKIRRAARKVNVTITAQAATEEGEAALMGEVERLLDAQALPVGYGVSKGERFEERAANERGGALGALVGLALVLCVMGVLFESFMTPLAILAAVPLAFVGAAWGLWLTRTPLEIMAIIGGVILVGVVVNNGIVLIDQVQGARRAGRGRDEALLAAARERLRPILMTTLTTVGGLIPMAVGEGAAVGIDYRPLGVVVISGMVSSTLLTLVAVPLLYTLLDDLARLPARLRGAAAQLRGAARRRAPRA